MKLANDGDDAMLRTMTDIRFAVECVVDAGGIMNNKSPELNMAAAENSVTRCFFHLLA